MEQLALGWQPQRRTWTVAEITARIRGLLESNFEDVWIAGEISGCHVAASRHCYFTLKDASAQIRCICYSSSLRYLKFKPQDGIAVLARGRVTVYDPRGEYQLTVESLEPQGHGALQLAFEQLKKKLAAEGLFEAARKRTLPKLPRRIGIVTSPQGAVIQDIRNVLSRRFPGVHLRLYPVLVQGEGAAETICRALEYFTATSWAEVVIVARGGGSLEDLWPFNEESVARAIVASRAPVISAVGHETDFTIADFVADLRAPTPSAAAELVICTRQELLDGLGAARAKLVQALRYGIAMHARALHQRGLDRISTVLHRAIGRRMQRIDELDYCLREHAARAIALRRRTLHDVTERLRHRDLRVRFGEVRARIDAAERALLLHVDMGRRKQMLDAYAARVRGADIRFRVSALRAGLDAEEQALLQAMRLRTARARARLDMLAANLTQLSPLKILDRGYAIVTTPAGALVKSPADAPQGATVRARLARGEIEAVVTRSE